MTGVARRDGLRAGRRVALLTLAAAVLTGSTACSPHLHEPPSWVDDLRARGETRFYTGEISDRRPDEIEIVALPRLHPAWNVAGLLVMLCLAAAATGWAGFCLWRIRSSPGEGMSRRQALANAVLSAALVCLLCAVAVLGGKTYAARIDLRAQEVHATTTYWGGLFESTETIRFERVEAVVAFSSDGRGSHENYGLALRVAGSSDPVGLMTACLGESGEASILSLRDYLGEALGWPIEPEVEYFLFGP